FDAIQLVARHGLKMNEVEPQAIGSHERSRLLHVRSEHLPERGMQKMRGCVIAARRVANLGVDLRRDDVADPERPVRDSDTMRSRQTGADARDAFDVCGSRSRLAEDPS